MFNAITTKINVLARVRLLVLLTCLGFSSGINAQEVLAAAQTGTIQGLAQDDGRITISGRIFQFDYEITRVYLAGTETDAAVLDEGMVVRYTLNNQGTLVRIEIIGPASRLRILQEH